MEVIFDAYVRTKQKQEKESDVKIPILTLSLNNGVQFNGRISQCDFDSRRLSFVIITPEGSMDVAFIDFDSITTITLHDLNFCQEFLAELRQIQ
ncbi:MAG: hypothetical protein ACOY3I_09670 [Verrucomicrobiota bacterium]